MGNPNLPISSTGTNTTLVTAQSLRRKPRRHGSQSHHHDQHHQQHHRSSPLLSIALSTVLCTALWYSHQSHGNHHNPVSFLRGAPATDNVASSFAAPFGTPSNEHQFIRALQETDTQATCTFECCSTTDFEQVLCPGDNEWLNALPFWSQILFIVVLIIFSALFSGLTLGLMGLDKTGLEIVMEGEDETNAKAAAKIYPLRSNGNLLLCTLLLGNVAVNSMLSILLSDKTGGIIGLASSTMLIVIFGEIIPQALCARYALYIGSMTVPIVRVIMVMLYPLSYPLAWVLNRALGNELVTTYSSAEMRKLLEIHVQEGRFDRETAEAMTGALKYKDLTVKEVMTPLEFTFMLNADEKLSFATIARIFKTGYSRIPVYEVSVNNVIGLLFVKDLIFIDPEDDTPVRNFVQIFGRGVHVVWPDDKLGDVLRVLKQGRSHMALVRDVNNEDEKDPYYEIKGIITLEDIIEKIIGDDIVDETDAFVDQAHSMRVTRAEVFDWGRLGLLDTKIVETTLSYEETRALTAHLRANYPKAVALLTDRQLHKLVGETPIRELQAAAQDVGTDIPQDLMYKKGRKADVCTIVLSGKVTVLAGSDEFRSDVSSWTVLAASALKESSYIPDFTAFVSVGPCRCLQISNKMFALAVDSSVIERRSNNPGGGNSDAGAGIGVGTDAVGSNSNPGKGGLGNSSSRAISPKDEGRGTGLIRSMSGLFGERHSQRSLLKQLGNKSNKELATPLHAEKTVGEAKAESGDIELIKSGGTAPTASTGSTAATREKNGRKMLIEAILEQRVQTLIPKQPTIPETPEVDDIDVGKRNAPVQKLSELDFIDCSAPDQNIETKPQSQLQALERTETM